jgi:hypothetical protein
MVDRLEVSQLKFGSDEKWDHEKSTGDQVEAVGHRVGRAADAIAARLPEKDSPFNLTFAPPSCLMSRLCEPDAHAQA